MLRRINAADESLHCARYRWPGAVIDRVSNPLSGQTGRAKKG
jgi:hypothetical protein